MNENIITFVATARMLASKDYLKAARFFNPDITFESTTDREAITLSENNTENELLLKKITDNPEGTITINLKNEGTVIIANSQHEIAGLLSGNAKTEKVKEAFQPCGRFFNRVFVITGGAQGFGSGIAEEIFQEGGNIVIADLNAEKGIKLADRLNFLGKANKAEFILTDVSNPDSVDELIQKTVLLFGGIDVLISNAGILRAGGLDEMTPETFRKMTEINYSGYFYCTRSASKVMKIQTRLKKGFFCDIIQINSKSGLKGSKKNFTYAGGKFGGVGLTQSFALELMEYNIKVNSICPGNFFEGPLWSDPQNGLFIQYLKAGKVAGAKTIDDVKKFYEKQVPAGRGCSVKDVARAVFYAIEQEYETGQAIPVTGGQIMLH